jgi:hypothetical protein
MSSLNARDPKPTTSTNKTLSEKKNPNSSSSSPYCKHSKPKFVSNKKNDEKTMRSTKPGSAKS